MPPMKQGSFPLFLELRFTILVSSQALGGVVMSVSTSPTPGDGDWASCIAYCVSLPQICCAWEYISTLIVPFGDYFVLYSPPPPSQFPFLNLILVPYTILTREYYTSVFGCSESESTEIRHSRHKTTTTKLLRGSSRLKNKHGFGIGAKTAAK
jgi:hypothetical protein